MLNAIRALSKTLHTTASFVRLNTVSNLIATETVANVGDPINSQRKRVNYTTVCSTKKTGHAKCVTHLIDTAAGSGANAKPKIAGDSTRTEPAKNVTIGSNGSITDVRYYTARNIWKKDSAISANLNSIALQTVE